MDQDQNIEIGTNAFPLFVFETNKISLMAKKFKQKNNPMRVDLNTRSYQIHV
jgi:hypothetical protein